MKIRAWAGLGAAAMLAACGANNEHGTGGDTTTGGLGGAGGTGTTASTTATTSTGTSATGGKSTTGSTATTSSGTTTSGGAGGVTVYVTPDNGIVDQIVAAIEGATTSVHMTMYILDNTKIVAALLDRKSAGLDVRVVMNQTFPTGTIQTNPATYTKLTAAGVGVVWRNGPPGSMSPTYTHEKTFILDGKQAWIMTMNADTSAPVENREYVVVDDNAADVTEADNIFLADFTGAAITAGNPLVVSPDPPCNSRTALVALINGATKSVDVEAEEFSDTYSSGVITALVGAGHRGLAVRVVVANDGTPAAAQVTAINNVKAAGGKVVVSGAVSGKGSATKPYIHAKAIVVDCNGTVCAKGYVGSENFTAGSLSYNRELGLIIDDATQLAKVEAAINTDFANGTMQ
jgi:cardiolipin synthase